MLEWHVIRYKEGVLGDDASWDAYEFSVGAIIEEQVIAEILLSSLAKVAGTAGGGVERDDTIASSEVRDIRTSLDDGACELLFEHRGLDDRLECKEMCSRSWDHFVGTSLRELAEGGTGAPNRSPRDLARRAAEVNG